MLITKTLLHTTDNYIKALDKAGIKDVFDLINHYPRDYEDRTNVLDTFSYINLKEKNTILVTLITLDTVRTQNGKLLTKAVLEDKTGFMAEAVWFNKKYFGANVMASRGKKVLVSGKVKYEYGKVTFMGPDIETDLSKIEGSIVPIYPDLNYIPGTWIASKIPLLESYFDDIIETLPESIINKYKFIDKTTALKKLHFPKSQDDIDKAKFRLAYEELFEINYKTLSKKFEIFKETTGKSLAIPLNPDLIKDILSKLPFSLTNGQKIALFQTLKDMENNHSMQRLLEGDVGTGKTVIAVIVAIHSIIESRKILENIAKTSIESGGSPHPSPLPEGEGIVMYEQKKYNPSYIIELSKELRKKQTSAEEILREILRNRKFNELKFRRQHPIGRYIADFYCDEIKLVIELDGKIHENQKEYDDIRNKIINNQGINILRFENETIYSDITKILNSIIPFIPLPLGEARGGQGDGGKEARGGHSLLVAFMAPTEILARQHFESIGELLSLYNLSSNLLVGSTSKKDKEEIKNNLKSGNLDVIIGTHALIQEDVIFNNLGFVVVDEQHRFGVKQREVLESGLGNSSGIIPHNLNMTATPIPRTLALTLYGDQDLSVIKEYPAGRKLIHTKVAKTDAEREQIELFVRTQIESGRQVFWISPLVEESEKIDLANAISTYETLQTIYEPFTVGLLHGKMKPKEKEQIMKEFSENKISILSSTSVVEVGVNIPNATIMCIEGAERFGLSQLHQFRGRVGRGQYQSYCYLFPTKGNYTDRLKAMERTNNGFELAEIDLELRGPGEVYGVRQSGLPDLKIADLKDLELVSQIREDIEEMLKK